MSKESPEIPKIEESPKKKEEGGKEIPILEIPGESPEKKPPISREKLAEEKPPKEEPPRRILEEEPTIKERAMRGLKELGERMIGRGAEISFRHEVELYRKTRGWDVSEIPRAAKEVFLKKAVGEFVEVAEKGIIPRKSKSYRFFVAGLNEMFGRKFVRRLKKEARLIRMEEEPPIKETHIENARLYYEEVSRGLVKPSRYLIEESAAISSMIETLLSSFQENKEIKATNNLGSALEKSPLLRGRLGKVMELKKILELRQENFLKEAKREEERRKKEREAKKSLTRTYYVSRQK